MTSAFWFGLADYGISVVGLALFCAFFWFTVKAAVNIVPNDAIRTSRDSTAILIFNVYLTGLASAIWIMAEPTLRTLKAAALEPTALSILDPGPPSPAAYIAIQAPDVLTAFLGVIGIIPLGLALALKMSDLVDRPARTP